MRFSPLTLTITLTAILFTAACSSPATSSEPGDSSASAASSAVVAPTAPAPNQPAQRMRVETIATHPFDASLFMEGIEVEGGHLLVSSGLTGSSSLSRRTLTGEILQKIDLPAQYFGEGTTRVGDSIWLLTYKAGKAFKYDAKTFTKTAEAHYDGEGWGLCSYDDGQMWMSNGTDTLVRRDGETFAETGRVKVSLDGAAPGPLNELSCTSDGIYANVFVTDTILRIDPVSGRVTAVIDASGLRPESTLADREAVLNGIAQIPGTDRFYLTGKRWPTMYEARFVPQQ
ncbi:glutaminyl-peptide cyclotransferase [Arcanobacterium wilhelmae]|uniref:Glutaminyl-peptide cyclotransferase n=1 Tax=Arcanobacterium wilhelmae TaxID=1803177 RepID=A0ABT9NCV5_9ACTO|nr:glutaminyl-peptide cyclotransferase [Arcanobacterium wilhelmae]MDP9801550.1 glutaminyl-peptide cyclotransferase [Arcanobacterium wilhelmae]WFN90877.1 glutaminyl-peptide cyclotransferase [Arcanobacterium wilhelmae]